MDKLVTIVIPVLNREDTLPRLFASLKAVTYPNVEIIFVDNGSTDRSEELILNSPPYGGEAVRLLHCPKPGAAAARNVGLAAAKGEYICFFDSDDEMSPTFIADMVALLTAPAASSKLAVPVGSTDGMPDLAIARTRMVWPDGREQVRAIGGKSVEAHIIAQGVNTQSWVARTELVRRVGGWNEGLMLWNDYELGVRLLLASHKTVWSNSIYHRIYQHEGERLTNVSGQLRVERAAQALAAVEADIAGCGTKTLRALHLRRAIVRGQLERLGLDAQCIECSGFIPTLLRHYTRWGGRAAWRMAQCTMHNAQCAMRNCYNKKK